jgi:glutathione S-transferase
MLKLHGFPVSNYANMVHFALLEKAIPFEYVLCYPQPSPELLARSPRGKVPFLETAEGCINETSVILEYLEEAFPEHKPLLPKNLHERAYVRALMKEIELYIELPARACYLEAIFAIPVAEAVKLKARQELLDGIATLHRHARFAPFLAGAQLTLADILFLYSIDLAIRVARQQFGLDLLADFPQALALFERLNASPHAQIIATRREADFPAFVAAVQAQYGTR